MPRPLRITSPRFISVIVINVLGHPGISRPDGPVTGRAAYRRRLALLSVLAAGRGRRVSRERLVGLLWAEHSQDAARHTLAEALYVLRKELGEGVIAVVGDEVGLDPAGVRTDVDAFECALEEGRLEDAVDLYGAPFLDGFHVSGAPEFERWVDGERDRLARACARALETLAERAEGRGDPLGAAGWWRRLADHDPFSSRVALRLVRALGDGGEHAAALRHAAAHAALLHDELGVGPDRELAAYVERLRAASAPLPPPLPRATRPAADAEDAIRESAACAASPESVQSAELADCTMHTESTEAAVSTAFVASAEVTESTACTESVASTELTGSESCESPNPGESAGTAALDAVSAAAKPEGSPGASRPGPRPGRRRLPWLASAAALLATVIAVVLLVSEARQGDATHAGRGYDPRRIAVLYFEDYSPGGGLEYLANGLTEMLIHELTQVQALDVISRNGVKPYRQGTVPLDSVAMRLRVGSIVEGSIQRTGDSVRVTVQLIDARTQSHLESRVLVRPLGDVVALESALVGEVGSALRRRLGREVRVLNAGAGTRSHAARDLVLHAEQTLDDAESLATSSNPLDAASALRLLQDADSLLARAQAADPAWARPSILRGRVAIARLERGGGELRDLTGVAEEFAQRVLRREPRNAEALQLRASARLRRGLALGPAPAGAAHIRAAEADLRAAVALQPRLAGAWSSLSLLLLVRGRQAEARLAADRALATDHYLDDAAPLLLRVFYIAMGQGDHRRAHAMCTEGARLFPRDWRFTECRLTLLREDTSRPPDPAYGWRLVEELEQMDPPARARGEGRDYQPVYRRLAAAALSARAGDTARARAELARARRDAAGSPAVSVPMGYDEAYLLLLLGDGAAARARLDAWLAAYPSMRESIARDPLFRELNLGAVSASAAAAR
jgi:DNA-binding SARP family transcriptional activator/TolB-like protein/tetratricopeptide (TPR) repeat protein